jgi:hypothetical protein
MNRLPGAILVVAVAFAVPLVWVTPALAIRSLTVSPSTGPVELDSVTIAGAAFNLSVESGYCEGVDVGRQDAKAAALDVASRSSVSTGDRT